MEFWNLNFSLDSSNENLQLYYFIELPLSETMMQIHSRNPIETKYCGMFLLLCVSISAIDAFHNF